MTPYSDLTSLQIPANHLLSASVMSAPAALAISKLFYPETEKSKTTFKNVKTMEKRCVILISFIDRWFLYAMLAVKAIFMARIVCGFIQPVPLLKM